MSLACASADSFCRTPASDIYVVNTSRCRDWRMRPEASSTRSCSDAEKISSRSFTKSVSLSGYNMLQVRFESIPSHLSNLSILAMARTTMAVVASFWSQLYELVLFFRTISRESCSITGGVLSRGVTSMPMWGICLSLALVLSYGASFIFAFMSMPEETTQALHEPSPSCSSHTRALMLMVFGFAAGGLAALDDPLRYFVIASL